MSNRRTVVDRIDNEWEYGHRESRLSDRCEWTRDPHSDYVRNLRRFWFQSVPMIIMRDHMKFTTSNERANEFENVSDNDPAIWWYLGIAASYGAGEEALKWVMGALAAEIKTRSFSFAEIAKIISPHILGLFSKAIVDGQIDRTFAKIIFTELISRHHSVSEFDALIIEPRFKIISESDLKPIIDDIISNNIEQFEKAKSNPKLVQFFVGQTMKATQGKAPPSKVTEIINQKLSEL